jgi:hypothetical protein
MSTNVDYLKLRDWYCKPHYFPSRTLAGLRDYYRYCFGAQTPQSHNSILSRQAANDARKPWLSTTTRERYYDQFSYLRKLRSIGEGKDVTPIPRGKKRVQCGVCDTHVDLRVEIDEHALENDGWYIGPAQTLCPQHVE